MAPVLALELHDAGATAAWPGTAPRRVGGPGVALVDGDRLVLGEAAWRRARLLPRQVWSRFWHDLDDRTLPRPLPSDLTGADLVYTHLSRMWEQLREKGDASSVLLAVPGVWSEAALGRLLGIARAAGLPVSGLVDAAVAAASVVGDLPARTCAVLDLHLHRAVVTVVEVVGGELERRRVEVDDEVGLVALNESWARAVAVGFVRQTRFDPLHAADSEQRLFLALPGWLDEVGGTSHWLDEEGGTSYEEGGTSESGTSYEEGGTSYWLDEVGGTSYEVGGTSYEAYEEGGTSESAEVGGTSESAEVGGTSYYGTSSWAGRRASRRSGARGAEPSLRERSASCSGRSVRPDGLSRPRADEEGGTSYEDEEGGTSYEDEEGGTSVGTSHEEGGTSIVVELDGRRVELERDALLDAVAPAYARIEALARKALVDDTGPGILLVAPRIAALPGLAARLARLPDIDVRPLPPGSAAVGALRARDAIDVPGREALPFVVRLPVLDDAGGGDGAP